MFVTPFENKLNFNIRPQLHKVTFYWIVPFAIFKGVYLYINPFGHTEEYVFGLFLLITLCIILMAIISLFKPWMMSVHVNGNLISQVTEFGGEIIIDIERLDYDLSVYDDNGLSLITVDGSRLDLASKLFKESDLNKLIEYIQQTNNSADD